MEFFISVIKQLSAASLSTLELFAATLAISLPLGLLIAIGRMMKFKPLQYVIRAYLLVMRGTPLMLQLIFFWYVLFAPIGVGRMATAIIAFGLNYSAYFCEIYRGGIESMSIGQYEAAEVLGFSKIQTFFRIILPQVVKKILPPMGNEFMTLVKDTSLAKVIAIIEITSRAEKLQAAEVTVIPVVIAGAFYLAMNSAVSKGFSLAEKKLSYYR